MLVSDPPTMRLSRETNGEALVEIDINKIKNIILNILF